jgi:hypothetical protein
MPEVITYQPKALSILAHVRSAAMTQVMPADVLNPNAL